MKQAKCISPIGNLTKDRIYTIVGEPDKDAKWFTVVDDEGQCATYASSRFELILTPKGSPDFSQMQHIADEVKITCPVVESYERKATEQISVQKRAQDSFGHLPLPEVEPKVLKSSDAVVTIGGQPIKPMSQPEMFMSPQQIADYKKAFEITADPNLAPDEWHLIFPDYRDLSLGQASKTAWQGGSNMTATFIVKRVDHTLYYETEIERLRKEVDRLNQLLYSEQELKKESQ